MLKNHRFKTDQTLLLFRIRFSDDKKVIDVDFARLANLRVNYESEKGIGPLHTLTCDEAKEICSSLVPLMRPVIEEDIRWIREILGDHNKDRGDDIISEWESGKNKFYHC